MKIKTFSTGLSISLISVINYFSVFPAFAQQTSCSSYWINPNTRQIECFGVNSNGNFGVIKKNFKPDDPFKGAEEEQEFQNSSVPAEDVTILLTSCKTDIMNRLDAPETAKFSQNTVKETQHKGIYDVRGYVHSKNNFWGPILQEYHCKYERRNDNDNFTFFRRNHGDFTLLELSLTGVFE